MLYLKIVIFGNLLEAVTLEHYIKAAIVKGRKTVTKMYHLRTIGLT